MTEILLPSITRSKKYMRMLKLKKEMEDKKKNVSKSWFVK